MGTKSNCDTWLSVSYFCGTSFPCVAFSYLMNQFNFWIKIYFLCCWKVMISPLKFMFCISLEYLQKMIFVLLVWLEHFFDWAEHVLVRAPLLKFVLYMISNWCLNAAIWLATERLIWLAFVRYQIEIIPKCYATGK